ncbi:hypothetical protein CYMTET_48926 [Cymbomonas tetramitiformis]|uniref:3'(2'),5'-bisphosphate nucleotidase n=1 Tax=Cymbomonas tetramitiformis TaxID=36881 RepID=A0AAE0BR84_9CHLO|nr:hypothetical protein CYMTET_48926 [Cymbomonas tetramitiformis]
MRVVRRAIRSVRANADTQIDVSRVVSACVELAERAGHVIRNVAASGEKGAVDKGGAFDIDGTYIADVQTKADRLVEDLVTWHIRACLPGLPLVAEEAAGGALQIEPDIKDEALSEHLEPLPLDQLEHFPWPRELQAVPAERIVLYVDPLDGTGEFNNEALLVSSGGRLSDAIGRRYEYRAKSDSSMGVPFENVHGVIASRDGRMHNTFVQTVSVSIAPWPLE